MNKDLLLSILKNVGEDVSREYEINWELWDDEHASNIETELYEILPAYEERFCQLLEDDSLDEEGVVNSLIYAYALEHIINRRKNIEDFISSI